jgi:signal transduction histidine kinase
MLVPLSAGSRVFGVITFVSSTEGRHYHDADLDFAAELGRRAGFAIENARLFREAQLANRVKDEFLATLSHELRTPLNVILGRSRMLADAPDLALAKQLGEVIERNAATLARLVEDLLDMSRMTLGQVAVERQEVHLAQVVDSAIQAVQAAAAAKQITIRLAASADLAPCSGDPTRLQQVVWNLLANAVKFTPPAGTIDVEVTCDRHHLTLRVTDSGEGIAPDALPRVFDMFWQAESTGSRRHGGLGIGLSIVRRLVELHGGRVFAESAGVGRGATFTVVLPCVVGAAAEVVG